MNYLEERPWGRFEILSDSDICKVKRITVKPGGRLSYQYHHKRSEVWTVVSGTATITLNELTKDYRYGDTVLSEAPARTLAPPPGPPAHALRRPRRPLLRRRRGLRPHGTAARRRHTSRARSGARGCSGPPPAAPSGPPAALTLRLPPP